MKVILGPRTISNMRYRRNISTYDSFISKVPTRNEHFLLSTLTHIRSRVYKGHQRYVAVLERKVKLREKSSQVYFSLPHQSQHSTCRDGDDLRIMHSKTRWDR